MTTERFNRLVGLLASATAAVALVSLVGTWVHMSTGATPCTRRPTGSGFGRSMSPLRPLSAGVQAPIDVHPADAASEVAEIIASVSAGGSSHADALDQAARHLYTEYGWGCGDARSFVLKVASE